MGVHRKKDEDDEEFEERFEDTKQERLKRATELFLKLLRREKSRSEKISQ